MSSEADTIRERKKRNLDEIARLQKENDEFDVALRVLELVRPKLPIKPAPIGRVVTVKLPPRPEGIPSTFEMVETILRDAERAGKGSLSSRELMDEIRAKYWPGVQNKQILPSIFGFGKAGRIIRDGERWRLKQRSSPPEPTLELMK
ncbi:hypothetical protein [Bradyrhizobium betae]|uniref:Uncharacterized protein n=1 Tax=Bradyrhizobium betae TaxID=244734 RepID=A0A4Q1UMJ2_9BRAD|nr:hypothetical protein [Bradyrhizobium betae]RXT36744.1 hypothetical protein B5V03_34505 [Bradyrhizobium betae]